MSKKGQYKQQTRGTIRLWDGKLLVEYIDSFNANASFVVENQKDIEDLIKELKESTHTYE